MTKFCPDLNMVNAMVSNFNIQCIIMRYRKISKSQYRVLKYLYRLEIRQAHRQQCCCGYVKFQGDRKILNSNLVASRLCEILQLDVLWLSITGPGVHFFKNNCHISISMHSAYIYVQIHQHYSLQRCSTSFSAARPVFCRKAGI